MKHFIVLSMCLSILIVDAKFIFKPSIVDKRLSKSICKITNDVINLNTDTQDILLGHFGGKVWSDTINEIAECIDERSAVVVTDFGTMIAERNLRKASLIIMELNQVSKIRIYIIS
jgi:hypothetical protein